MKLPRNLDDLVESGRSGLDDLVEGGRKGARRLYADGRGWIGDRLPDRLPDARPDVRDVRRAVEAGRDRAEDAARRALRRAGHDDRLRAPVRWIEAHLPEPRRTGSVLWPSVLAAAGAGVAFWWWTSWAQGRAEAAERAALDAAGGAAGAEHPERVMAHAAEPADAPVETPDPSAAKLSEPAEELMAHTPPPPPAPDESATAARAKAGKAVKATADEARLLASTAAAGVSPAGDVKSLDESLAVQGAAKADGGSRS